MIAVPWGLKLSGGVLPCARGVGWPWGVLLPHPTWSWGCQTAARGALSRGKMSPSETIKLLNKTRCLCECSMFFSVCLGSATLTSWPYRGAAEGTRWTVQETGALANFSALKKPGQGFNAFALQANPPLSFPPSPSATFTHRHLMAQPGELPPSLPPAPKYK